MSHSTKSKRTRTSGESQSARRPKSGEPGSPPHQPRKKTPEQGRDFDEASHRPGGEGDESSGEGASLQSP